MKAYYLGSKQDERGLAGPGLLRNLRGEAARLCVTLAVEDRVGDWYLKIFGTSAIDFGQFRLRPALFFDFGQFRLRPISTSANFDFGQFLDVEFFDDKVWGPRRVGGPKGWRPKPRKSGPRRVGAPKGGAQKGGAQKGGAQKGGGPKGWGPEGWGPEGGSPKGGGAQNFVLFLPFPATISLFLCLFGFFSWDFGGV